MNTGRRGFIQTMASAWLMLTLAGSALWLQACSAADVITDIATYVPIGIAAVNSLLNLLGSFGVIPVGAGTAASALLATITAAFNAVLATIKEYQATPTTTLLSKIQDLLQSISDNVSSFVAALKISDNKVVQLIGALLSLFLTTLAGFISALAAKMGATPAAAAAASRRKIMMQSGTAVVVEAKYRNAAEFKKQFNAKLVAAGKSQFEIQ